MLKRLLLAGSALTFGLSPALAAVTANSLVTTQTPKAGRAQLANGSLGPTVVYTAGANGAKCFALYATNSDTGSETLTIDRYNGATANVALTIATVITAGFATGVPSQNLMSPAVMPGLAVDGNGNPFFFLNATETVRATSNAVTSGKFINIFADCADL